MAARKGKKVMSVVVAGGLVADKEVDYGDRRFGLCYKVIKAKINKTKKILFNNKITKNNIDTPNMGLWIGEEKLNGGAIMDLAPLK